MNASLTSQQPLTQLASPTQTASSPRFQSFLFLSYSTGHTPPSLSPTTFSLEALRAHPGSLLHSQEHPGDLILSHQPWKRGIFIPPCKWCHLVLLFLKSIQWLAQHWGWGGGSLFGQYCFPRLEAIDPARWPSSHGCLPEVVTNAFLPHSFGSKGDFSAYHH